MIQTVIFTKPCALYMAGEVAGFPPKKAEELVKRGVARFYAPPKAEPEQPQATAETATEQPAAAAPQSNQQDQLTIPAPAAYSVKKAASGKFVVVDGNGDPHPEGEMTKAAAKALAAELNAQG